MKQLRDDARYFRESETVESGARDREALFHERRLAMDARAVWPLLLKLRHLDVDTDDREACFVALESYLVRRLMAGYQARSYDRVALELIEALSEQAQIPEAPSKAIRTHLLSYSENANLCRTTRSQSKLSRSAKRSTSSCAPSAASCSRRPSKSDC